jgi:hypothetical protein
MTRYLINLYQPDGVIPPPEFLDKVMSDLGAVNDELRAAGQWVFSGALHQPSTATVVRTNGDDVLTTDGPYAEGSEHIGGFWIVDSPDLDAALGWAAKISGVTMLPTEVRPFHDDRQI